MSLLKGLDFIHQRGYVHCDLKPQNIFLSENKESLLIADFGLSSFNPDNILTTSFKGTKLYMAPEVINRTGYTKAADLYSLGCVLYEMCTLKRYKKGDNEFNPIYELDRMPRELQEKIIGLLNKDPTRRITLQPIINALENSTIYKNLF